MLIINISRKTLPFPPSHSNKTLPQVTSFPLAIFRSLFLIDDSSARVSWYVNLIQLCLYSPPSPLFPLLSSFFPSFAFPHSSSFPSFIWNFREVAILELHSNGLSTLKLRSTLRMWSVVMTVVIWSLKAQAKWKMASQVLLVPCLLYKREAAMLALY